MRYKLVRIPFDQYIIRFLEKEYPHKDGILILKKNILRPCNRNGVDYKAFFKQKHLNKVWLPVLTQDSKLYKLYYFKNQVEHDFNAKMEAYIHVRLGLYSVAESIRLFMEEYRITASEYSHATGYKRWQRSIIYQNIQQKRYSNARN